MVQWSVQQATAVSSRGTAAAVTADFTVQTTPHCSAGAARPLRNSHCSWKAATLRLSPEKRSLDFSSVTQSSAPFSFQTSPATLGPGRRKVNTIH